MTNYYLAQPGLNPVSERIIFGPRSRLRKNTRNFSWV